jgi:hypothetical protein
METHTAGTSPCRCTRSISFKHDRRTRRASRPPRGSTRRNACIFCTRFYVDIWIIAWRRNTFHTLNPYLSKKFPLGSIATLLLKVENLLTNRTLTLILAIVGVVAISLTGLLGGVMIYGTSADPLAPFILKILGLV